MKLAMLTHVGNYSQVIAVIAMFLLLILFTQVPKVKNPIYCTRDQPLPGEDVRLEVPRATGFQEEEDTPRITDEKLMDYAPELFQVIPPRFLEEYKNPCFYKNGTTDIYCLPYFYIVGMAKCGTTDLWDKLVAHRDVINVPKEPHWWGLRRFTRNDTVPLYKDKVEEVVKMPGSVSTNSVNFYLNWFKHFAVPNITSKAENGFHPRVFGDASISTATGISERWKQLDPEADEPPFVTADLIHAIQPNAKIIIMVRNTTSWAHSWYRYSFSGATSESFQNHMVKFIGCIDMCLQSHTERYCAYADGCGTAYNPLRNIHAGVYHWYIKDWIRTFSREGVFVIPLEDWESEKVAVYRRLLKYLDLKPLRQEQEGMILARKVKNVISEKFPIKPNTKELLKEFFKPHNHKLAELLDDDRYNSYV